MDKKEQIQGLLKEWREEDSDKRTYVMVMIQVGDKDDEGYDTLVSTYVGGCRKCMVDAFTNILLDKSNYLHDILHNSFGRYMDKRFGKIFERLTDRLKDSIEKDDHKPIN